MIIDPETGETIYKGDSMNARHLWDRYDLTTWHCKKCECKKKQTGEKQYIYVIQQDIFEKAPLCTNSKLITINFKKNESKEKQLEIEF